MLLLDTVEEIELIGPICAPTDLLVRLFHEEQPRVFDAQPVRVRLLLLGGQGAVSLSIYSQRTSAR